MDDFSTPGVVNSFNVPASPANYIFPHKRPMSSMSPAIIVDGNGDVRLLVGAAGGTKITTSVAAVRKNIFYINKYNNLNIVANVGGNLSRSLNHLIAEQTNNCRYFVNFDFR